MGLFNQLFAGGKVDVTNASPPGIVVIKNARMPERRFEWHPQSNKVYMIDLARTVQRGGQTQHEAVVIAEHADSHGQAFGFVQTWCRGFYEGQKSLPGIVPA